LRLTPRNPAKAALDGLGIGLDLNAVAPEIEPVLDALIRQALRTALQQAAGGATEAVWSDELETELAQEPQEFREQALHEDPELVPRIDAALAELERPPRQNHVAHALVWRAALELMRRANRNYERMAELEQTLAEAPPAAHRHLSLPVAAAASLAADVGDLEAAKAITEFVVSLPPDPETARKTFDRATARLARTLATDKRRRDVRASLAELARGSAEEFPVASAALERLLAEPIPKDAAKDDLWVSLVVGLAQEQLAHAFADETLD
jgi:hypothetical protein